MRERLKNSLNKLPVLLVATLLTIVTLAAQSLDVPDWQTAAGGKLSFEVASVKPTKLMRPPNFPLDSGNAVAAGGRFSAVMPLLVYIFFAYKVDGNGDQARTALSQMPKDVTAGLFEIEARAGGNATKDQMRLMMQSLLAERFKLGIHFETREVSAMALTLDKPGKLGPKLRPHSEGPPCPDYKGIDPASRPEPPKPGDPFPPQCDVSQLQPKPDGTTRSGSRNTTPQLLARDITTLGFMSGEVDKPVVDRTGLSDRFDYVLEWSGLSFGPPPPGAAAPPPTDAAGTTFLQAVREQLGLKLVLTRAPVRTLVIDHVEMPSEN
jgi:bla regulator protein BlaR1